MERRKLEISLGVLVIGALAVLAWIAIQTGHLKGIAFQVRVVAVFDNAVGLVEGAAVRVAGVQVGRVETLTVDFDRARATLLVDSGSGLRSDALAAIRARSLLGEKFVELLPQSRTAPTIAEGTELKTLPSGYEIDQVISSAGPLLEQLNGLQLSEVKPLLENVSGLVGDNRAVLTQSVGQLQALLARLESLKFDDPALQQDILTTARNLRTLSEALPGTISRTEQQVTDVVSRTTPILEKLDRTLTRLEPAIASLEPALARVPGAIVKLEDTMAGLDKLVRQAGPLLTRAESINYDLFKKLLREEGLLIRFVPQPVEWPAGSGAQLMVEPGAAAVLRLPPGPVP